MTESPCPVLYPSVILLAAGKSERMGTCKQLLDIEGKTVIQVCIENLLKAGLHDITVVTGIFHSEIKTALSGYDVRFAVNDKKNSDMADSIRIGLKNALIEKNDIKKTDAEARTGATVIQTGIDKRTYSDLDTEKKQKKDTEKSENLENSHKVKTGSGIMIHLSDHPLVRPSTLKKIAEEYSILNDMIIIPVYNGRKGHPVVVPEYILRKIESGGTLRDLISAEHERNKVKLTEVDDMGILFDMDTPDDYREINMRREYQWKQKQ